MNELHIIHHWKQAEEVRNTLLRTSRKEPVTSLEWYTIENHIEWHNTEHPDWKRKFVSHVRELKTYDFMESYTIVLWNAQNLSENEWTLWKDIRNDIRTIFVSDRYIHIVRRLGIRVIRYPIQKPDEKRMFVLRNMIQRLVKKDWKAMIDVRNHIIAWLEWNQSFVSLSRELKEVCMKLCDEHSVPPRTIQSFMQTTVPILSDVQSKMQCAMACERVIVILLKVIEDEQNKES